MNYGFLSGKIDEFGKDFLIMRILIAEDETELAKGLKFLLEKNKFSVDIVHNGIEALDFFHSTEYDAIVLDIMMPGMDGMTVLVILDRKNPQSRS